MMMNENLHSHERAVSNIERMLEALSPKKKIDKRLQENIDAATMMSIRDNKVYVVVDIGGQNYQIWPKSVVERYGHEFVYSTGDAECA